MTRAHRGPIAWEPVLPAQGETILNSMRSPGDGVDVIQVTLDWTSPLEREPFEAAWRLVARRYPVLGTTFRLDDRHGLVQRADAERSLDIRWRDLPPWSPGPDGEQDLEFDALLLADRRRPLDFMHGPLVWLTIVSRGGAPACRAILSFHHSVLDGRSLRLLIGDVTDAYAAIRDGRAPPPPPLAPPFHDFARWWHMQDTSGDQAFWTSYLAGAVLPRPLPGYAGAGKAGTAEPATAQVMLSRSDSELIRRVSRDAGLRSSTIVTAAWALLRSRYGSVSDVMVAVTRSCRHDSIPGAEHAVGPMVNTLPLRVRIGERWTVRDLLTAVHDGLGQIAQHRLTPMGSALSWAGLAPGASPIDSLVMFDRRRLQTGLPGGDDGPSGATLTRLPSFPLTWCVFDEPEIVLSVVWDRRRFAAGSAERMLAQVHATMVEMAANLAAPLATLDLGRAEEAGVLARWNRTSAPYPADATIPALFAAQAGRDPGAPAVICGAEVLSYAELDRRSNALAWLLRRRGVTTDMPVAVALPRGTEAVTALLAVLKAGGAYLPVDTASPAPRIASMLAAAGARHALVATETAAAVPELPGVDQLRIDKEPLRGADQATPPPDTAHPLCLAYISFTSGSTGVPKGVAVPQRAVIRLISDPVFAVLGPGQRLLHLAPVAFDASTLEIWGALLTGATVVVAPPGPLGLAEVASLLRGDITMAWLTAGLFHQLAETAMDAIASVPVLLSGGDVLSPDTVAAVVAARRGRPLVNGYGPTENTTFTTCHVMTAPDGIGPVVPIGRPIQQTAVHILGEDGRPAPIGVVGELYAGGDGLARGYSGNAAATARAFVPDPAGHGKRLYRTGDLARWRADGTLEFAGRADGQIKIRGFRVEPGEVETVLRAHPDVADAVVIAAGEGSQRHLIGYVVPAEGADAAALRARLRGYAATRLPDYLVPAAFSVIGRLPLTANGKVDRAALPAPERESGIASPPAGATEERLAAIWRALLPREVARDICHEDSFFALGGNSLLAARLVFRIHEVFGVELGLAAFYQAPTLAACAKAIDEAAASARPAAASARPAAAARPVTARPGTAAPVVIARRDRSAYRVAAEPRQPSPQPAVLAPHLVRLTDDWAVWRSVLLRAAGFPFQMVAALGDPGLAAAADAALAARDGEQVTRERADARYAAEFTAAVRRLSKALYAAAVNPRLREAVAWQNRHALANGIDALVRRGPEPARRNTQLRQHGALIASYLQRYCAKNDTIGFFGPVGWTRIDDGPGIRVEPAAAGSLLAARVTYLEGWSVRAIMARHVAGLRPWLVPRRMPFTGLDGTLLRLPLAPPVRLTPAEAAVMAAIDGVRDARQVAAAVRADPSCGLRDDAAVFALLARLADSHRIAWQVDVAPQDIRPEHSVRAALSRVTDAGVRGPAEMALDELTAARDELAGAAGDAERVATAMAGLETTFTRLAGVPPTRRAGELYAGRTLAYEECLRGGAVRLGADTLDGVRSALALVLDSARWFIGEVGELYARHFEEAYRERASVLGTGVVPFADLWLMVNETLFDQHALLVEPAVRELRQRWSAILNLPSEARRVRFRAADLREQVAAAFPAGRRPWPMAVHHSPDLLISGADAAAGGRLTWVLGEVHPSIVTIRYASWMPFHDSPDALLAAMRHDLRGPAVWIAETAEYGGSCTRLANVLLSADDLRLVFAHDSCGYDPALTITVGDCDVIGSPAGLRVRHRDRDFERDLLEVVGDLLSAVVSQRFDPVPPAAHTPRVTIDDLVMSRERWLLAATDAGFADARDESTRYLRARAWAADHGFPRHVFLRFTGERKPIYADLTSLASIDLIARAVRRCRRNAGAAATVTVTEMLPAPDQAWLADADGQRYTAELRMVAVDQTAPRQQGKG